MKQDVKRYKYKTGDKILEVELRGSEELINKFRVDEAFKDIKPIDENAYEIISFVQRDGSPHNIQEISRVSKLNSNTLIANMLNLGYHIHSIKRLSDNKIFSVGDCVNKNKYFHTGHIIERFIIHTNNSLSVLLDSEGLKTSATISEIDFPALNNGVELNFSNVEYDWGKTYGDKLYIKKKSLGKTEDGKDFFMNDTIYIIYENSDGVLSVRPVYVYCKPADNVKLFSTKKAAEDYLIDNNVCLTFKEVKDLFKNSYTSNHNGYTFMNKLYDIVKGKKHGKI